MSVVFGVPSLARSVDGEFVAPRDEKTHLVFVWFFFCFCFLSGLLGDSVRCWMHHTAKPTHEDNDEFATHKRRYSHSILSTLHAFRIRTIPIDSIHFCRLSAAVKNHYFSLFFSQWTKNCDFCFFYSLSQQWPMVVLLLYDLNKNGLKALGNNLNTWRANNP